MDFQDDNNTKELMTIFQDEAEEILEKIFEKLELLNKKPADQELTAELYRLFHSVKGATRMVGFNNIQLILHKIEDIFDAVRSKQIVLNSDKIGIIIYAVGQAEEYIKKSVKNCREMIDSHLMEVVSQLDELITKDEEAEEKPDDFLANLFTTAEGILPDDIPESIAIIDSNVEQNGEFADLQNKQEEINALFNSCFELIDEIVPEEEAPNVTVLQDNITQIYNTFEPYDLYEIKTSLQNILTKIDFVINASNSFTISEILELRNELSSVAAKFNTMIIDTESVGITFFDVAEKLFKLQTGSIYAQEIKDDILILKETVKDSNILEIVNIILEIIDFIIDNSIQLEEQMIQVLKSGIEYCASPNENIDVNLIIQQLEIMKQLLELNFKKDADVTEIKNLSAQNVVTNSSVSNEIKTLHVNAQKLDTLVNQLGELIITKIKTEKNLEKIDLIKNLNENCQKDLLKTSNYLRYYNRKYLQSYNGSQYSQAFTKQVFSLLSDVTQNISKTIYDLNNLYRSSKEDDVKMRFIINEMESMIKNIRVLPISTVFNSFSRMVRDIATEKGKEIDFEIQGNDTCVDKKIIEEIKTPLIHILRNSIDHGIETKEERLLAGKNPVGRIVLSAKQDDNKIIIDVIDDGQGFNLEKIKDRAVSRGFLTKEDLETMSDESIMNIIFWPGFTTGDSITSISGRGIGLDVVKTKISQLNGKVKVISEFNKGSCVHIEIPITLTTLRVFLVQISNQTFAIPINVITTFILKKHSEIKTNNGAHSILYNGKIIPLYYLADILGLTPTPRTDKEFILIIDSDDKTTALVVDKLLGDQNVLQKKFAPPLYKVKNIAGITNLASGELCLILNMQDIIHYDFNKAIRPVLIQRELTNDIFLYKKILTIDDSITTRIMIKNLLVNIGCNVDAVLDIKAALLKLKLNHYDLIIIDWLIPQSDVSMFIDLLKKDEMYHDIPIVVMSFVDKQEILKTLGENHVDGVISKGDFNQDLFINTVKEILTKYHVEA